jgi:hypothetical protein
MRVPTERFPAATFAVQRAICLIPCLLLDRHFLEVRHTVRMYCNPMQGRVLSKNV